MAYIPQENARNAHRIVDGLIGHYTRFEQAIELWFSLCMIEFVGSPDAPGECVQKTGILCIYLHIDWGNSALSQVIVR